MNKSVLTLVLCCLLLGGGLPYQAAAFLYADKTTVIKQQKRAISAKQAANIVKSRYGGKVLKVSAAGKGYRVKLLKKDGRIISVYVDGVNGKIRG